MPRSHWEASTATAHDLPARLEVDTKLLEARRLEVTPPINDRLRSLEDVVSIAETM